MKPEDFDEIIEEPLLTDEGFLNPVAMNAVEAAINSIPPTYERLAGNTEWSTPRILHPYWITAALAKWAIRQSPYHRAPDGLLDVLGYLDACLRRDIVVNDWGSCEMTLCQIDEYLHKIILDLPSFRAWNEPKKGNATMIFLSAYDGHRDPDYDFIDLEALLHNVCLDIRDEWRANDRFDANFAGKYPKNSEKE